MASLEALAAWVGRDGRPVSRDDELAQAGAAEAAGWLGIGRGALPYLWESALTSGWLELDDAADGVTLAVPGQTALRWADGGNSATLGVWAVTFAAVLAAALEVAASAT